MGSKKKVPLTWENRACLGPVHARSEGTFPMHDTARRLKITVSADGRSIMSLAGAVLLTQTLRLTGLDAGLPAGLARWRAPPDHASNCHPRHRASSRIHEN